MAECGRPSSDRTLRSEPTRSRPPLVARGLGSIRPVVCVFTASSVIAAPVRPMTAAPVETSPRPRRAGPDRPGRTPRGCGRPTSRALNRFAEADRDDSCRPGRHESAAETGVRADRPGSGRLHEPGRRAEPSLRRAWTIALARHRMDSRSPASDRRKTSVRSSRGQGRRPSSARPLARGRAGDPADPRRGPRLDEGDGRAGIDPGQRSMIVEWPRTACAHGRGHLDGLSPQLCSTEARMIEGSKSSLPPDGQVEVEDGAAVAEHDRDLEDIAVGRERLAREFLEALHRVHELHLVVGVLLLEGRGVDPSSSFFLLRRRSGVRPAGARSRGCAASPRCRRSRPSRRSWNRVSRGNLEKSNSGDGDFV